MAEAAVKLKKADFFAMLHAEEAKKPPVGTVHAAKKDDSAAAAAPLKTQQWTCFKCSTVNDKHDQHCKKCRSVRRMGTGYR